MSLPLSNSRVLLTGARGAIGSQIALTLALAGARLFLISRHSTPSMVSLLPPRNSGPAHHQIQGDIRRKDFWALLSKELREELAVGEHVNVLVNAAGVTQRRLLVRMEGAEVEDVVGTNLVGAIMATKTVMPGMLRARDGVIVNVGSVVALTGLSGSSVYAASKAGLLGFSRSLVQEMAGKGVRVNTVMPGYIEGGMTAVMGEREVEGLSGRIPAKRFGTPEEVARVVLEMVKNQYMNGAEVVLDGGMRFQSLV